MKELDTNYRCQAIVAKLDDLLTQELGVEDKNMLLGEVVGQLMAKREKKRPVYRQWKPF